MGGPASQEEETNLNNQNDSERDIINLKSDNRNTLISRQISSAYTQDDILSSSLEAELREMGWQEDSENDETCAPLTEDEMRGFQAISDQLQKNSFRVFLRNALAFDLFQEVVEKENSETSSSYTSDDE
ncbi:hypothetical protein XELAEV_18002652mg [Xenopus laevis]|nr:hypothetical protein XELAEV_18002652mg [Xenopus laevis]